MWRPLSFRTGKRHISLLQKLRFPCDEVSFLFKGLYDLFYVGFGIVKGYLRGCVLSVNCDVHHPVDRCEDRTYPPYDR